MKLLIIEQINSSVLLSVALIIQIVCNANVEDKREQRKLVSTTNTAVETHISPNEAKNMKLSLLSSANTSSTHDDIKITSRVTSNSLSADSASSTTPSKQFGPAHITPLDSGAVRRGFYVFVGLTIVVMAYIIFRSLRLNKSRAQMVRKYGVLAHRQDVEMRPLPLEEEDDEDTTVFDASNALNNSVQHQNS